MRLDGTKVKRLRWKQDWTQETLSKKARLSLPVIGKAEAGINIDGRSAERIAAALGVELEEVEMLSEMKTA